MAKAMIEATTDRAVVSPPDTWASLAAGEHFARVVEILLPDGKGLVAVLESYSDGSGTHEGSPITCVAGYVFTPETCRQFNKEWRRALDKAGVPYLHMKEFAPGIGPYEGMRPQKRLELHRTAIEIIKRRAAHGVAAVASEEEFNRLAPAGWTAPTAYGGIYTNCVQLCLVATGLWVHENRPQDGPVAYFFEKGDRGMGDAIHKTLLVERDDVARRRYYYGSCTFLNKDEAMAFQAADVLAWEIAKFFRDTLLAPKGERRPPRESLRALMAVRGQHSVHYLRGEHLKRMFAENPSD